MEFHLLPDAFIDPITHEPLVDPVVAGDGHTYSRAPIEEWFRRNPQNPTSPKTNARLSTTALVPNITVQQAMEEMRVRQPMALDRDRLRMSEPEELIGEGGCGRVLAGTLRMGAREVRVAVKTLSAAGGAGREAFQNELKALMHAARHCDGICVLYGTCELESRVCLVMKRYERSLRQVIAQAGNLEVAQVRRNSHTLFRVLGQLHDSGLVVRDIKPDNILEDRFGDLVISDFGVSKVMENTMQIQPSRLIGTIAYMAPEALSASDVGPPVDIWAMACVVLEMHTGTPPWRGMEMQHIMYAVLFEEKVPDVPAAAPAADLLRRCFAKDPAYRPQATELVPAFAPTFEAAPAAPVEAVAMAQLTWQLEASQGLCERLQMANLEQQQELVRLRPELQDQQHITEQVTAALTAMQREAERHVNTRLTFDSATPGNSDATPTRGITTGAGNVGTPGVQYPCQYVQPRQVVYVAAPAPVQYVEQPVQYVPEHSEAGEQFMQQPMSGHQHVQQPQYIRARSSPPQSSVHPRWPVEALQQPQVALTRNAPNTKDDGIPTDAQAKAPPKRAGIGITLQTRAMPPDGNEVVIIRLLEGGSADKSGKIQAGDVITSINNVTIAGWELPKVVEHLTGPDGTSVQLGLRRQNSSFEVPLERRQHASPAPGEEEKLKQGVQRGSPTVLAHTPSGLPPSFLPALHREIETFIRPSFPPPFPPSLLPPFLPSLLPPFLPSLPPSPPGDPRSGLVASSSPCR